MKTVLLLGGPAAGQLVQVHGTMDSVHAAAPDSTERTLYHVVPLCSHGVVHWFGVLDKSWCPLVALIQGYGMNVVPQAERYTGTHPGLSAPYGIGGQPEPKSVEIRSATKLYVDVCGRAPVVPDIEAARRLEAEGFKRVDAVTYRKETF